MEKFIVQGGGPLRGDIPISGAKNVALKAFVAALLTDEPITIHNVPAIRDVSLMLDVVRSLGVESSHVGDTVRIHKAAVSKTTVPLEVGARLRTSSLVVGPLLARYGQANIPNPGGCRIGARPIDRHVEALKAMGAHIDYDSNDGYFHATAKKLKGTTINFPKNTHTGTEAIILAAVLAEGTTTIHNAALEVEVDDLIALLCAMGAKISRTQSREITIEGVATLHGTEFTIMSDRNEEVTFAIAAALTDGDITVQNSRLEYLEPFLLEFAAAGGGFEIISPTVTKYFRKGNLVGRDVTTAPHPGFMTDWQAPWAVLMTQAKGVSTLHEAVFESRFSYVPELKKMGAHIEFFDPPVSNPEAFYNFNWDDRVEENHQAIKITGPTQLHNAVLEINDLRAGATLLLAALHAHGESVIFGIEQIDRGYEKIEERIIKLGANIKRIVE